MGEHQTSRCTASIDQRTPPQTEELAFLRQRHDVWRGQALPHRLPAGLATGMPEFDASLVWGGWPPAALCECLSEQPHEGLGLLLPALAGLTQRARWVLLIDPPCQPFAPTLAAQGLCLERLLVINAGAERAWVAEQGLRSPACGAVLIWGGRWERTALRRLQLAAEQGGTLAVLFRDEAAASVPSPAVVRLQVRPSSCGYEVTLLKQRGGVAGRSMILHPLSGSASPDHSKRALPQP